MDDLRGVEAVVVAGLGPTAWCLRHALMQREPDALGLIGVNDFDAIASPDVLVVADHEAHFHPLRAATIRATRARRLLLWPSWAWDADDERVRRLTGADGATSSVAIALRALADRGPAGENRAVALLGVDLIAHELAGDAETVADEVDVAFRTLRDRGWHPVVLALPRILPVTPVQRLAERWDRERADDWLEPYRSK